MKFIILVGCVALAGCAQQHAANACFVQDVKQAARGDWSGFVLPAFLGVAEAKRARQWQRADCSWTP